MNLHILNIFSIILLFCITWYKEFSWLLTLQFSLSVIEYSGGVVNELGKQLTTLRDAYAAGGILCLSFLDVSDIIVCSHCYNKYHSLGDLNWKY